MSDREGYAILSVSDCVSRSEFVTRVTERCLGARYNFYPRRKSRPSCGTVLSESSLRDCCWLPPLVFRSHALTPKTTTPHPSGRMKEPSLVVQMRKRRQLLRRLCNARYVMARANNYLISRVRCFTRRSTAVTAAVFTRKRFRMARRLRVVWIAMPAITI